MGFENKTPVDQEMLKLSLKIKREEQDKLDKYMQDVIGQERLNQLMDIINQLSNGVKHLILFKEKSEHGSSLKIEELLHGVSNNIFLHAIATNGKPEKLIRALEEFRDKTNFS